VLFDLASEVHRTRDPSLAGQLKALAGVIGLLQQAPRAYLQSGTGSAQAGLDAAAIEQRIQDRAAAKKARDFAAADAIRAELALQGVELKDTPQGTTWVRT
jgi:cysteinyl-tRNA synthetase